MKRALVLAAAILAVAAACGGRGGEPRPQAPRATASPAPTRTAAPSPTASAAEGDGAGDVLPLVFGNAFGAASGGAAGGGATLGPGDPSLEQYLLTQDDLPAGFIEQTSISQRVSDKISDNGAVDMSMSIAARGEPGVSTDAAMVMSMVMRFEDLQDLDRAFGQAKGVSEQDLQDELEQLGELPLGIKLTDVHLLDSTGLDNGFGMTMTMDFGELFGALAGEQDLGADIPTTFVMRMYVFGEGRYGGGIISMTFGDGAPAGVDELALAKVLSARVAAAP